MKNKFDENIWKKTVLDFGYVQLLDVMGDDEDIAQTARTSTNSDGKEIRPLIRHLMRKRHTSPFEFGVLKFKIKAPIAIARQIFRHRMSSINEISGRYVEFDNPEFYVPCEGRIAGKGIFNKQGSEGEVEHEKKRDFIESIRDHRDETKIVYAHCNKLGVANELSRFALTLNFYTEWMWKIDLHNLFHFLKLREDSSAQAEIRDYAFIIDEMVKELFPISYEAWVDYVRDSVTFSRIEWDILNQILELIEPTDENLNKIKSLKAPKGLLSQNEIIEFSQKIKI